MPDGALDGAPAPRVALVGAGFSGSALAVGLLGRLPRGAEVALFDPRAAFGPGLAYGAAGGEHLLNVRAGGMSALADDPAHFTRWLRARGEPLGADDFAPRGLYGAYVARTLAAAARDGAARGVTLRAEPRAVVALDQMAGGARVLTDDAAPYHADVAVLCLGNFPPATPLPGDICSPRVIADPWAPGALDHVGADDPVALLGTGLTMVDVLAALERRGHRGPVLAFSRRGLLPRVHASAPPHALAPAPLPTTARGLVRRVRAEVAHAPDWRSAVDAFRPATQAAWRALPEAERRRVLRHARAYWDVHRHRLAPAAHARLADALAAGRLTVAAARVIGAAADETGVRLRLRRRGGDTEEVAAAWLVNCSGPQTDYARLRDRLVRHLLDTGQARPDALRLGLDVTDDFALRGADGTSSTALFAAGPPTRGLLWEIVAVPDIRAQIATLSDTIVRRFG